jgi:hypothetical protein
MIELADRVYEASVLLGGSARQLHERLHCAGGLEDMTQISEDYFSKMAALWADNLNDYYHSEQEAAVDQSLHDLGVTPQGAIRRMENLGDFRRGTICVNYCKCGKKLRLCAQRSPGAWAAVPVERPHRRQDSGTESAFRAGAGKSGRGSPDPSDIRPLDPRMDGDQRPDLSDASRPQHRERNGAGGVEKKLRRRFAEKRK